MFLVGDGLTSAQRTAYSFKAFLYYTYTGQLHFAPLRSRQHDGDAKQSSLSCSPKSMYRLADKVRVITFWYCERERLSVSHDTHVVS